MLLDNLRVLVVWLLVCQGSIEYAYWAFIGEFHWVIIIYCCFCVNFRCTSTLDRPWDGVFIGYL